MVARYSHSAAHRSSRPLIGPWPLPRHLCLTVRHTPLPRHPTSVPRQELTQAIEHFVDVSPAFVPLCHATCVQQIALLGLEPAHGQVGVGTDHQEQLSSHRGIDRGEGSLQRVAAIRERRAQQILEALGHAGWTVSLPASTRRSNPIVAAVSSIRSQSSRPRP